MPLYYEHPTKLEFSEYDTAQPKSEMRALASH